MAEPEVAATVQKTIEDQIAHLGFVRMQVLPESTEQLALDIIDALESAGFSIVKIDHA